MALRIDAEIDQLATKCAEIAKRNEGTGLLKHANRVVAVGALRSAGLLTELEVHRATPGHGHGTR